MKRLTANVIHQQYVQNAKSLRALLQREAPERTDDDIIYAVTSSTSTCPSYDVSLPDVCQDTAAGYTDAFILPRLRLLTTSDGYPQRTRTQYRQPVKK